MKKFIMKADIEFSAEDITDAFKKLERHFSDLYNGTESGVELIELGEFNIYLKDNFEYLKDNLE